MTLGSHIAALRAAQGLSQAELAERLEVSRQSVSKWETDGSIPELDKLLRLAEIFGVTLDELVKEDASGTEIHNEGVPAPVPADDVPRQPLRVTVGSALLLFGALLALIFSLQGYGLAVVIMVALPFLSCGMVCLLLKELLPLWCGWCVYLWIYLCNHLFPGSVGSYGAFERLALLGLSSLPLLTGWYLRDKLLGSPERRRFLAWAFPVGAAVNWMLQTLGREFYGTVVMWLSQGARRRWHLLGLSLLRLSFPLSLALVSTVLAVFFYYAAKLWRKKRS